MNVKVDISSIILTTKHLILRPFQKEDLEDFYEYASISGVGEMAGWTHHKSLEESKNILDIFISEKRTFALVDKNCHKVIGSLGLERYDENVFKEFEWQRGLELGYVLSKKYWGKGLMKEAVIKVIEYLFLQEGLDFITCAHFVTNLQSKRVIEKCGFHFYKNGIYEATTGSILSSYYILRKEENAKNGTI